MRARYITVKARFHPSKAVVIGWEILDERRQLLAFFEEDHERDLSVLDYCNDWCERYEAGGSQRERAMQEAKR